jgi:hypothetical protein
VKLLTGLLDSFAAKPLFIWGTIAFIALVAAIGFQRWDSVIRRALAFS